MGIFTFYLIGFAIALILLTYDFYKFSIENGVAPHYVFSDLNDVFNLLIAALGSWITIVIFILTYNDDE